MNRNTWSKTKNKIYTILMLLHGSQSSKKYKVKGKVIPVTGRGGP
jgi:hypothetical protein